MIEQQTLSRVDETSGSELLADQPADVTQQAETVTSEKSAQPDAASDGQWGLNMQEAVKVGARVILSRGAGQGRRNKNCSASLYM